MFKSKSLFVLILACFPLMSYAAKGGGDSNKDGLKESSNESRIAALEEEVVELNALLADMKALLTGMQRLMDPNTGQDTLMFSGMNVQIVNGLGATNLTDGTGNLIIGYNETRADNNNFRGGSHNLVIGAFNNYTELAYGGMSVGEENETAAPFASVTGGSGNLVDGWGSTVTGGRVNTAGSKYAVVSGGVGNAAIGWGSSVSGGRFNTADWWYATVSGGNENNATGYATAVSGGNDKNAEAAYCWEGADDADC